MSLPSVNSLFARMHLFGPRRVAVVAAILLLAYWALVAWFSLMARDNIEVSLQRDAERIADRVSDSLVFSIQLGAAVFETIEITYAKTVDRDTVNLIAAPAAHSALSQLDALVLQAPESDQAVAVATGAEQLPRCPPLQSAQAVGHAKFTLLPDVLLVSYRLSERWSEALSVCVKIGAERLQWLFDSAAADDLLTVRLVHIDTPERIASTNFALETDGSPLVSRLLSNFPLRVQVFSMPNAVRNVWMERLWPLWLISVAFTLMVIASALRLVHYIKALEVAATRDGLTGLLNRRYFYERAEFECQRQQREHGSVALLLADVDHFKRVNDTYGHAVGDEVLRAVAKRLRDNCRGTDLVARYGGEEFIVLLSPADAPAAGHMAERLRSALAAEPIPSESGPMAVTISIGLFALPIGNESSVDAMAKLADEALYRAKAGGRNRVELATKCS
jgi:diguanylate cyclase (GGDEF)-like protein